MVTLFWAFIPKHEKENTYSIESPESSFFQEGNVQSRIEYETEMVVDPKTGVIPHNIRQKELQFAKELNLQNQLLKNRLERSDANSAQQNSVLNWSPIGPQNIGGRTRAIRFDIRDENLLIAGGVTGGIYKSTNLGQQWTRVSGIDEVQSVTSLAQDKRAGNQDTWYYGTGELIGNSARAPGAPYRGDGIYRSTDNGDSWTPLPSTQINSPGFFGSPFQYVWDLAVGTNPNQDEIYAAVIGGIVKSIDGGDTWETVLGVNLLGAPDGTDLNDALTPFYTDVHIATNGDIYATLSSATNRQDQTYAQGGVYRSVDGVNWSSVLEMSSRVSRRIEVRTSESSPNIAYFLADMGNGNYELWRYDAATAQLLNYSPNVPDGSNSIEEFESQGSYNLTLGIHPDDSNVVFIGGTNLYRSTDGFSSRREIDWIGGYNPDNSDDAPALYPGHHPDQHELLFLPSDPNKMISANDGGIFFTENNLAEEIEYTSLNNGFVTTQFYTATYSRYELEDFVIGGTQDNGSILTFDQDFNNGPNGINVIGGDGGFTATTPIGVYYYMSFQNSQIYRLTINSEAQITSFARVDPTGGASDPSQPYLFINPYVLDPNNTNRMYLAGGSHVWYNRNLSQIPGGEQVPTGVNWKQLERTEVEAGSITAIQVSTEPRNVLYYGTGNGQLFKVINVHSLDYSVIELTQNITPNNGSSGNGSYIRSIAIDPTDANHLLVCYSNYGVPSIFRSTNGGLTFTDISGNLEENPDGSGNGPSVRWVSIVPTIDGANTYFAGTTTGLYSSLLVDGRNTIWDQESQSGIGNSVVNMIDYRRSDGKIVAATHGNGLFTSQVSNVVQPEEIAVGEFLLEELYPNPFSEDVAIKINLPETQFVLIRIYDTQGNQIRLISSNLGFRGENEFFWDGNDVYGNPVANGVYLIRVTYKGQSEVRRAILQRN